MKRILLVFGTRPEAIKMAPVIKAFAQYSSSVEVGICVTAQHRQMLDKVLDFFSIKPQFDLNVMREGQSLFRLTADIIVGMEQILKTFCPHFVLVHGDTTTSLAASLAAFYAQIPVGHVEAGLRTYHRYEPFPEEVNRQLTSRIASYHFAPTETARENLLSESVSDDSVFVTGNTVIDALYWAKEMLTDYRDSEISMLQTLVMPGKKNILVTAHRRENLGEGLRNICKALLQIASYPDVQIIFPVHLNPVVRQTVHQYLGGNEKITLIEPLGYPAFTWLMLNSYLIITDSGGIQEEAPGLGKPVLVMRDFSERPEAIEAGSVKLVGTDNEVIYRAVKDLLDGGEGYQRMATRSHVYGDGKSAERIAEIILNL
ncbi:non-hydrolyzing UDP-N-acetylglucosamine 2-epimerase [Parapedobacter pyrenivorans]|uniref:non-hydrolyzing UDP-N-acetylglucosamine 2-epimerase n=1 Tax=Parapedobacter pyrenivorans TaxID=1305674 RepID=UPI00334279DA